MAAELGTKNFDTFIDRTHQGIESLLESIFAAGREPERAAFWAAAPVAGLARFFGWQKFTRYVEPAILPLLLGTVVRSGTSLPEKASLSVGLTGATAAQKGKAEHPRTAGAGDMLSVVGQYSALAVALMQQHGAVVRPAGAAARGGLVAAGAGLAAWKNRQLLPATVVGGAAMTVATELANDPKVAEGNVHAQGVRHGANLMLASEALTLLRGTLLKNRRGFLARSASAGALSASLLGNVLLIDGLVRR